MGKNERKVKVNPLPIWSILATFSTVLKWSKKASKTLKNDSKNFKGIGLCFSTISKMLKKWPKMSKKLRLTPYHFGQFWPPIQLF